MVVNPSNRSFKSKIPIIVALLIAPWIVVLFIIPLIGFLVGWVGGVIFLVAVGFLAFYAIVITIAAAVYSSVVYGIETPSDKILKSRSYLRHLKQQHTCLQSKINYSAIVHEDDRLARVESINKKEIEVLLIAQAPQSTTGDSGNSSAWLLYDAVFWRRNNDRLIKGTSLDDCYTIFEAQLEQQVPRLVFDSKKARGSQFKKLYADSQKLAFDAAVSEVFTVYAPHYHEIEALSFITPEVIVVIAEMPDCDIELIGDSLIVFTRLLEVDKLEEFKQRSLRLLDSINNNLAPQRRRPRKIESWGHYLLENPRIYMRTIMFAGAIILASPLIYVIYRSWAQFAAVIILSTIGAVTALVKMNRDTRRNRHIEATLQQGRQKRPPN